MAGYREFETGATRTGAEEKLDIQAFNSPVVDKRYAEFMHENRYRPDGTLRSGSNWQLGIPIDEYLKSATRHFTDWRLVHEGYKPIDTEHPDIEQILCATLFNTKGYLYEILKQRGYGK